MSTSNEALREALLARVISDYATLEAKYCGEDLELSSALTDIEAPADEELSRSAADPGQGPLDAEDAWVLDLPCELLDEYFAALPSLPGSDEVGAGFWHSSQGDGFGFASGGTSDALAPGPVLAGLAERAWEDGLDHLDDDALVGVLSAARRLTSWAGALELAATANLANRRLAAEAAGKVGVAEHVDDEIAAALTLTGRAAGRLLDLAQTLDRLPATMAALRAGEIDQPRAAVIADETALLGPAHRPTVEAHLLRRASRQTTGELRRAAKRAVIAVDPAAARKRKEKAQKDARVERWEEDAGTAALAGRDLPPVGVLAADKHLTGIARALKDAGVEGTMDNLRALAYLALLAGQPISSLFPTPPAAQESGAPGHHATGPAPADPAPAGSTATGSAGEEAAEASDATGSAGAATTAAEGANATDFTGDGTAEDANATDFTGGRTAEDANATGSADDRTAEDANATGSADDRTAADTNGTDSTSDGANATNSTAAEATPAPAASGSSAFLTAAESRRLAQGITIPGSTSGVDSRRAGLPPASSLSAGSRAMSGLAVPQLPPLTGSVNLTMPLATWLGVSDAPGNASGYGPLDASDARLLGTALAERADTKWCITLTDAEGRPAAHGCASPRTRKDRQGRTRAGPDRGNAARRAPREGSTTQVTPEGDGAARAGPGWDVMAWNFTIAPLVGAPCNHLRETAAYQASPGLRHVLEIRHATCSYAGCQRPAERCDLDHTVPYDRGGRTCTCNLAPACRRHHKAKQTPGWRLVQSQPGHLTWTTPSGRSYTSRPTQYPE